jgi:DNA primase catalytic subunit
MIIDGKLTKVEPIYITEKVKKELQRIVKVNAKLEDEIKRVNKLVKSMKKSALPKITMEQYLKSLEEFKK